METRPKPTLAQITFGWLDLYTALGKDSRESLLNKSKYTFEYLASYYTKQPPVDTQLDNIVKQVKVFAKTAQTSDFDARYNMIIKLREYADDAQALKTQEGESKLQNVLHAIADTGIHDLETGEDSKLFEERIDSL